jgi:hypothetical protein
MDKKTLAFWFTNALFVLIGWMAHSVVQFAIHRKLPIFGGGRVFRTVICGTLILAACFLIYLGINGFLNGSIEVLSFSGGQGSSRTKFINFADNPDGFWDAVCIYLFLGLVFIYVSIAEIIIYRKLKKYHKPGPHD